MDSIPASLVLIYHMTAMTEMCFGSKASNETAAALQSVRGCHYVVVGSEHLYTPDIHPIVRAGDGLTHEV